MEQPPHRHDHEKQVEYPPQAREDWFGRVLGERWESDGDGIYRLVPQTDSHEAPAPPPRGPSEDLEDALAPSLRQERGAGDDAPAKPKPRRALWQRR